MTTNEHWELHDADFSPTQETVPDSSFHYLGLARKEAADD